MKSIFVRDPFDIAPQAQRHTQASWVTLAAGLLFAGVCVWPLAKSVQAMKQSDAEQNSVSAVLRAQAEGQRAARLRQNDPAVLERARAQQKLQHMMRMSWAGLFEALEAAAHTVRGGVSILALLPSKTQADAARVSITALAANPDIMLKYIGALQNDQRVRQVEITMQQPDDKAGPEVVRFQLSVLWDPSAAVSPSEVQDDGFKSVLDASRRSAHDRADVARVTRTSP